MLLSFQVAPKLCYRDDCFFFGRRTVVRMQHCFVFDTCSGRVLRHVGLCVCFICAGVVRYMYDEADKMI